MNYAIYIEQLDDYRPILILEGDDPDDVEAYFDLFKNVASELEIEASFYIFGLDEEEVDATEASIYEFVEDRPELVQLINDFFRCVDNDGDMFFNPELN